MDRKTFHALYEATPEDFRAELIEGIVYLGTRKTARHCGILAAVVGMLGIYEVSTAGTEGLARTTVLLGDESEPEPDATLLILPERGGQTRLEDDLLAGPPELLSEVAEGVEDIDLHSKKRDYERAGVREYVVVALRQQQVFWFRRQDDRFVPLEPGSDGIFRSEIFPGLWLDPDALLKDDKARLLEVLRQGIASSEHAAFVERLAGLASP